MTHDAKRKSRRREKKRDSDIYNYLSSEAYSSVAKGRARILRNSPWWRKKISGGKCHYCGCIVKSSELTMDHKIPVSKGGKSEKNNIVPACKKCNNMKKNMLPVEWLKYLEDIKDNKEQI